MDLKESKKEQLYLYDLDIGSKLVLNFNVKGHPFEFHVKVEKIINKIILLSVIYIDNKVLNLKNAERVSLIYTQENEQPLAWHNLTIETYKTKDKSYYVVNNNVIGIKVNRRNAFRVNIGKTCDFSLGNHSKINTAIVKDLSTSGFYIIIEPINNINQYIGKVIKIVFDDALLNYHITLEGEIKRIENLDRGNILLGCKLIKEYNHLNTYINLKQRDLLSNSNVSILAHKVKTIIQ